MNLGLRKKGASRTFFTFPERRLSDPPQDFQHKDFSAEPPPLFLPPTPYPSLSFFLFFFIFIIPRYTSLRYLPLTSNLTLFLSYFLSFLSFFFNLLLMSCGSRWGSRIASVAATRGLNVSENERHDDTRFCQSYSDSDALLDPLHPS